MQESNQPINPSTEGRPAPPNPCPGNLSLLADLTLPVRIRLGSLTMRLGEVLELAPGSYVEIEQGPNNEVELLVSGRVIARGQLVVIDNNFGVRVESIIQPSERITSLNGGATQ